jgi:6,7-dimethyl-8-ribityllumazine synthase
MRAMTERYDDARPFDLDAAPDDRAPVAEPVQVPWEAPPAVEEPPAYAAEDVLADVVEERDELPEAPPPEPEPQEPRAEHAAAGVDVPDGYRILEGEPRGDRRSVAVVVGRFNGAITNELLTHALEELEACGVARDAVTVLPVPGAFELPLAAMALAKTRRYACVIALGCVIRGETPHFDYVASEAASGLQLAALETGTPVAFGVLTCENREQARARVGRGADAVRSALEMADVFSNLRAAVG